MKALILFLLFSTTYAATIEVMSYNVENLFDTQKDEGKNDWSYLPKNTKGKVEACKKVSSKYRREECYSADWTQEKLDLKLSQIKDVVLKERKKLPDLLVVSEIENENVIGQLAKVLGYKKFYTSNSPDYRGVDLAVLFNETKDFKYVSKREHVLKSDYLKKRPSRNIFEVQFKLGNNDLYVFANHWPSLGNPDEARVTAATTLKTRIDEIMKKNAKASVLAVGDFNTIPELKEAGNKHPMRDVLLKDGTIVDVEKVFRSEKSNAKRVQEMPPGTYYYAKNSQWNHLDRVFVPKVMLGDKHPIRVDLKSYKIYAPDFIRQPQPQSVYEEDIEEMRDRGFKVETKKVQTAPNRYDHLATKKAKAGYSDHFPLVFELNY
ncbi:endonuclease/exonuclease/phosphatase family protein [Halobacteriovorax sp. RT-2-4]|uniref:endonuclease/exonuclease/phosphatase family protein n=1 Tax=unclassified Halobacteriovorax TaxID=2639665 RepID=UPI00399AE63C